MKVCELIGYLLDLSPDADVRISVTRSNHELEEFKVPDIDDASTDLYFVCVDCESADDAGDTVYLKG